MTDPSMLDSSGKCDVLIVGAGPSGAAAGIELARAGARVVVLDRARFPRHKTCGDALSNRAVALVDDLAPGDLAATPSASVAGALAIFPDGATIGRSYGDEPGRIVPRFALDLLLRRALERAGAEVHEGVMVRRLLSEGGRVVGAEGDAGRWRAGTVIAADGPGSIGWEALGEAYPRGRTLAVSATAYFEGVAPGPREGWSEHHFHADLPCGYGWIFPAVEGLSNVGVYLRSDAYASSPSRLRALFDAFLAREAARFGPAKRVGTVRSWALPLAGALSRRRGVPGLLLTGDAGRAIDPLTGEGIWQALHTGRLAGTIAAKHLAAGGVGDDAVREYEGACAAVLDRPARMRALVQDGVRALVSLGLYRAAPVQALLRWGYASGSLETSKTVHGGGSADASKPIDGSGRPA